MFVKNIYGELYQDSDYYGQAIPEVLEYFEKLPKTLSVLDVGCGQGRYATALAKMGFNLTAIDNSKRAINQLDDKIKTSGLKCRALLKDAFLFEDYSSYDVLFFHLFFHFNPHEIDREKDLLLKISRCQNVGSRLVTVTYNSEKDLQIIKSTLVETENYKLQGVVPLQFVNHRITEQESHYILLTLQKNKSSSEP